MTAIEEARKLISLNLLRLALEPLAAHTTDGPVPRAGRSCGARLGAAMGGGS